MQNTSKWWSRLELQLNSYFGALCGIGYFKEIIFAISEGYVQNNIYNIFSRTSVM